METGGDSPSQRQPSRRLVPPAVGARHLSVALGFSVAAVGLLVLVGWTLGIPELTGFFGPITMKTNAAIGLLLSGVATVLLRRAPPVSAGMGGLAALIGGLTLFQHLTGRDLGIDQALFTEAAGAVATASPNRMGPNASTSLLLAGTSLVLLVRGRAADIRRAQGMAIVGIFFALLATAGYLYGATQLFAVARITGIAFHTALALIALHVGILAARPEAGVMAAFVSDGPDGALLRRIAVPITVLPLTIGFVVMMGRRIEIYDLGLGNAFFAMALIVVLWMTVWQTARNIGVADRRRRRAEQHRDELLIRERRARDDAEHANRLKDQFIATLSHELRTPLNVMLGWTRVIEAGGPPDAQARATAVVARNGRLLARLVEDLLDISRVMAGQFEIVRTPLAINHVAQAAIDALMPAAMEKRVTLTSRLEAQPGLIEADHQRLQQVVSNLLSNAVKFTPPGGRVEVRTAGDAAEVVLTVTDTGKGFDAAFAPHVFEPFRQADPSTRREHGGLGLGLSIARHLVELHGGSISAASEGPDRGATFTVSLPALRTTAKVAQASPSSVAHGVRKPA